MEKKGIDWAVSVDKLKVCLNMPEHLFEYLKEYHTRYKGDVRILEEDDFFLVFTKKKDEEDETNKISAILNVRDIDGYFRLGTFDFFNTKRYKNQAFFTFENSSLYRIYSLNYDGTPNNCICCLLYVMEYYGIRFNNSTETEIAFDCTYDFVKKVTNAIKNVDKYQLYINGKLVEEDETLDGYGEYYTRKRIKLNKTPTLYFHHKKTTDMQMKIYDKAKELQEESLHKSKYIHEWLNWDDTSKIFRIEVTWHNNNVREAMKEICKEREEWSEHENFLNLIGLRDFLIAMLIDGTRRLIYFKDIKTQKEVSIFEL